MSSSRPRRLGRWRNSFQWLTTLSILLIPFGSWNGDSLLRIDIGRRSLHLCGQILRIQELYLMLFFTLAFGLGFLLMTLVFGRVWCGWACPQTTLSDVAEWIARRFGLKINRNRLQGDGWRKILTHCCYLLLALLVAANLIWYFIAPETFFTQVLNRELPAAAWGTLVVISSLVYIDLALVRRLMCREFCPYGRFQTALVDPGTLTLQLPASEQSRCIKCGSCVRACPMEIDIRRGDQIECINCGRCLDACRVVMDKRQQPGLIRYSFGRQGQGVRALLNPRTLLLGLVFCLLLLILTTAVILRAEATLKVAVSHTARSRVIEDGSLATFFTAWISNRTAKTDSYALRARTVKDDIPLVLRGQTQDIELAPGANRKVSFVVVSPVPTGRQTIEFLLIDKTGRLLSQAAAEISPP